MTSQHATDLNAVSVDNLLRMVAHDVKSSSNITDGMTPDTVFMILKGALYHGAVRVAQLFGDTRKNGLDAVQECEAQIPFATPKKAKGISEPQWLTLAEYQERVQKGEVICSYCPNRGVHKGKICSANVIDSTQRIKPNTEWRCTQDISKKGVDILNPKPSPPENLVSIMPLPAIPGIPMISHGAPSFPPPLPVVPTPIVSQPSPPELSVRDMPGLLKGKHYIIDHPGANNWLLTTDPVPTVLGKFSYIISDKHQFNQDYLKDVIPITPNEMETLIKLGLTYSPITVSPEKKTPPSIKLALHGPPLVV